MKTKTFWVSTIIAIFIIFGGVAIISSTDKPKESEAEGYIYDMEPMEITVPIRVIDFSDEPPMLITPNMAD